MTEAGQQKCEETTSEHEPSISTTLDAGRLLLASGPESAAVSDTGAKANLACFRWLKHHNRISEREGNQKVPIYSSSARFRFGGGSPGDVRHAADIPEDIAGGKGKLAANVLDADIPAFLRKGAFEHWGGNRTSYVIC